MPKMSIECLLFRFFMNKSLLSCPYFVKKRLFSKKTNALMLIFCRKNCPSAQKHGAVMSFASNLCLSFSKKIEICPFWCEWDLISKRYQQEKIKKKKVKKKQVVNNRVQKKDKKVPSPSSKTAQDFLPRSSQSENPVFHFPQKKKIFRFWCEWDLISTRYSKEKTQTNL